MRSKFWSVNENSYFYGGKIFAAERYLYQAEKDEFVLLREENYRDYIQS